MTYWTLLDAQGAVTAQIIIDGTDAPTARDNPSELQAVQVERFGDLQREQLVGGEWAARTDDGPARAVDSAYLADNGPLAIRLAHMQKSVEAQHIVAGRDMPDGLVAAEAVALGIDREALAASIVAKSKVDYVPEVDRRLAKMGSQGGPA